MFRIGTIVNRPRYEIQVDQLCSFVPSYPSWKLFSLEEHFHFPSPLLLLHAVHAFSSFAFFLLFTGCLLSQDVVVNVSSAFEQTLQPSIPTSLAAVLPPTAAGKPPSSKPTQPVSKGKKGDTVSTQPSERTIAFPAISVGQTSGWYYNKLLGCCSCRQVCTLMFDVLNMYIWYLVCWCSNGM